MPNLFPVSGFLGEQAQASLWLIPGLSSGAIDFWITLIMTACIGAASGWFASIIMHGQGQGIIGNIVLGFLGAYVGHWLFDYLRIPPISNWSYLGEFIYGLIGAIVLLLLFGRFFIQKESF
jgi:uncharacterized membrane protein YeaQ/YmgE (transglycosylase-associated protein family)